MANRSHAGSAPSADAPGMTRIHGSCSECGDVEVPVSALSIDPPDRQGNGSYEFSCPRCACTVREAAGLHLVEVLVAFGAQAPTGGTPLHHKKGHATTMVHVFAA